MQSKQIFISAVAGIATLGAVVAQSFSGQKITDVQVQYTGDKTVDEQRIISQMSSSIGSKYNAEKLDTDIRTLYRSGLVDNVSISGVNYNGGVKLIAKVTTRPILASVAFSGNTKFYDKTLARKTELVSGKILGAADVVTAKKAIVKYYRDFNFPNVIVTHTVQKTTRAGYANLVFNIQEGGKNTIKRIKFEGNRAFDHNLLLKEMKSRKKGIFSFITKSGQIDHNQLADDVEKVIDFYKDNGYLKAYSSGAQINTVKNGKVEVRIPIHEGQKYTVNSVSFGKMTQFTSAQLLPTLVLDPGDPYSQSQLREDIKTIRSYYGSKGFANANVTPKITNSSNNTINIHYEIAEGKPFKVGKINISGNSITKDKVIRREVTLRPGQPFNSVEKETIQNRIKSLNYFDPVYVDTTASVLPGHQDMNIQVKEQQTGNLSFGAGFSSIDSIVGFVNVEQRNFDILNWRNFRGGGQRLNLSLRAGDETTDASISLIEPWIFGRKLEAGVELYYKDLLFLSSEYDLTRIGAAVHLRKSIGKKSSLRGELRWERNKVELEDDIDSSSFFNLFVGDFARTELSLSYIYDSRNSRVTTRRGHRIESGLTFSIGDAETYTAFAKGSKYWNFKYDIIWNLRGEIAATQAYGDNELVPIFDRHFLGGARTLRGFEFNDVGARDASTEEVYGSTSKGYITSEFTFPVVEKVRGAVFGDIGTVGDGQNEFGDGIYSDAGVGVRLNLPIGPIALDYAFPLTSPDPEADKGPQFNFYVNTSF